VPRLPTRANKGDFHFHTYDYVGSAAWTLTPNAVNGKQFYSMVADLAALKAAAQAKNMPNVALYMGPPIDDEDGRKIMTLSFGNTKKPKVMITGGIHAREWMGAEIAYLVAEYLVRNYPASNDPLTGYNQTIRDLVQNRWIHITPMLNPNGIHYTVYSTDSGARWWRKNCRPLPKNEDDWQTALTDTAGVPNPPFRCVEIEDSTCQYSVPDYDGANRIPPGAAQFHTRDLSEDQIGVDLNRNFPTAAWGYEGHTDPSQTDHDADSDAESYFGPRRGSEAETAMVQAYLAGAERVDAAIDYHAYGEFILYPPEAYDQGAVTRGHKRLGKRLQSLIVKSGQTEYGLGSPMELLKYTGTGCLADFLVRSYQARAFAIELDPMPAARGQSPLKGFDLAETEICSVFEKNIRGALALIAAAGTRRSAVARQFLGWNVEGQGNQLPAP
jgi:hypothetical protein